MTAAPLPPGATIGIVGGGQLGRMSAIAAARLGYRVHVLTDDPDGPACQVAADRTVGAYDDPATLERFAGSVDVVTFEFENVSAEGLELLARLRPVRPGPAALRVSQDRVAEKSFLNGMGIPTAPWRPVGSAGELAEAAAALGLPAILKTARLGYDGKGQRTLRDPSDLDGAWEAVGGVPCVLEGMVDFAMECSAIVARSPDGATATFDPAENRHRNHILDLSLAPARVPEETAAAMRGMAERIAVELDLEGLMAVEFFVDRDGRPVANEIAPRPHNSGHWTIEACRHSQFDLHVRAVAGLPLPDPGRHSDAAMRNLVGPDDMAIWPAILACPGLVPHHYGKAEARPGRKMGHATRLFARGALPGEDGVRQALGPLARS